MEFLSIILARSRVYCHKAYDGKRFALSDHTRNQVAQGHLEHERGLATHELLTASSGAGLLGCN